MVTFIFRLSIFAMVATIVIVFITPLLTVNKLLYPLKIDSIYVSQQQFTYEKGLQDGYIDSTVVFFYSPGQLNLKYHDMKITLHDSIKIFGWMAIDTLRAKSPLILILPDISEGAINYLPSMKQFCDRGFNVCVMNMRGQGNSEGLNYDFTKRGSSDLIYLVNELKKLPYVNKVAILGNGTGAAIAMKAIHDSSGIADVLVLQNPPLNLAHYFHQQAVNEWGNVIQILFPALRRSYEQQTGIDMSNYDYEKMVKTFYIPHMMVAANFSTKKTIEETVRLYHSSEYFKKQLFIENESYMKPTGFVNSKKYYDKISAFINSSLPSTTKKTRFRKLAFN